MLGQNSLTHLKQSSNTFPVRIVELHYKEETPLEMVFKVHFNQVLFPLLSLAVWFLSHNRCRGTAQLLTNTDGQYCLSTKVCALHIHCRIEGAASGRFCKPQGSVFHSSHNFITHQFSCEKLSAMP